MFLLTRNITEDFLIFIMIAVKRVFIILVKRELVLLQSILQLKKIFGGDFMDGCLLTKKNMRQRRKKKLKRKEF
ncbi:MAG: hypothetical protein CMF72_10255 [Mameliella sp.]|nr:hypothetical protein [Mameliella sp.]